MSRKLICALSASLAATALLLAPAAGDAAVTAHHTSLTDHCIVEPIGSLTLTICVPT